MPYSLNIINLIVVIIASFPLVVFSNYMLKMNIWIQQQDSLTEES